MNITTDLTKRIVIVSHAFLVRRTVRYHTTVWKRRNPSCCIYIHVYVHGHPTSFEFAGKENGEVVAVRGDGLRQGFLSGQKRQGTPPEPGAANGVVPKKGMGMAF